MKGVIKTACAAALLLVSTQAMAADHQIKMLNAGAEGPMVFEPSYLKVAPGDTVTFVATDAGHNSQSFLTPDGAQAWTGGMNENITVTLDKEGVYLYKCAPHTVMAMVGVIQVGEAKNKDAAVAAATQTSAQFVMNQGRLNKYMEQVK